VFAALADPTRRRMLERLARDGESCVSELAKPFPMTPPAVTKHLRVLEQARLIRRRRHGREHFIRANAAALGKAHRWMAGCAAGWQFSLQRLDALIAAERREKGKP
jgi:DNA-binding transcriptional ArsR family regulator